MGAQVEGSLSIAANSTATVVHSWLQRLRPGELQPVGFAAGQKNHADATLVQGEKILHVDKSRRDIWCR